MADAGMHRTIPALPVRSMDAAVAFYRDRFGFAVRHHDGGFAVLSRDDAVLHLWEAGDEDWRSREDLRARPVRSGAESFIAGTASARIEVGEVDGLFAELEAAEVLHPSSRDGVAGTDFGTREFATLDLDGNLLSFFRWKERSRAPERTSGSPRSYADKSPWQHAGADRLLRSMRTRLIALTFAALLLPASPATAGDPIMPLSQVRPSMRCTGYSVVHGTEISSFDVEILEVIDGDASGEGPRLLVRVSGPAVDGTGVGPGFSGSPIYCLDDHGISRNAGAISESLGEYGGYVALATPIEAILGASADAPANRAQPAAVHRYRSLMARAKPLASPLTVSGVSTAMGRALERAGRRSGRPVLAAPAGPLGSYAPQAMRPGASIGVSYSMGDIQIGAIGTVAYTDGDRVWAFGHPFENAGARRLLLQDAYVYRVIDNPIAIPGAASTYKFASLGHTLGTISNDERDAVAGRTGALPPTVPIRVFANDLDTGQREATGIRAADESRIGLPEGVSPLSFVGPLAVTEAATSLLRSAPGRLSADVCAQISIEGLKRPARFCNRYVSAFPADEDFVGTANTVAARASSDVYEALSAIDDYQGTPPRIGEVAVRMDFHRGEQRAFLRSVKLPRTVRPGQWVRARVVLRRARGGLIRRTYAVRVPRFLRPGFRTLRFSGTDADVADDGLLGAIIIDVADDDGSGDPGPRNLRALASRIGKIRRYDGVRLRTGGGRTHAFRDPQLRISGRASATVRVARR